MANYLGFPDPVDAVNKTDLDIFGAEHGNQALTDEKEIIRTGRPLIGIEEKETWKNGRESWVLTTKVPLRDSRNHIIGTMGISHNITDRKQIESQIHYMALHDSLTGLPNRTLLMDRLTQSLALAHCTGIGVALLMLDLDHFKKINDSLGHRAGDCMLQAVSIRLRDYIRECDVAARLGGDEFVVLLSSVPEHCMIDSVPEKILSILAKPYTIANTELRIGTSIGISLYPADGNDPETLLQAADDAMYEAKSRGRGNYCYATRKTGVVAHVL